MTMILGTLPEQTSFLNLIAPYLKKILRYYILYSLLQRAYVTATIRTATPVSVGNMKFLILMKLLLRYALYYTIMFNVSIYILLNMHNL